MIKDTEYLVFGYIEPDTRLLYSEFCTYTRPLKNVTKDELKILQDLGKDYADQDEYAVLKPFIEDFELEPNKPDIYIKKLKRETGLAESRYEALKTENRNLKILLCVIVGILVLGICFIFGKRKFKTKY